MLHLHPTIRWEGAQHGALPDDPITPEAPLAIRLLTGSRTARQAYELAVTMRTPGADEDLVRGYLFAEGIIHKNADITQIRCPTATQVEVVLAPGVAFTAAQHARYGVTSSSCGLCGKSTLEQIDHLSCYYPVPNLPVVAASTLYQLPGKLQQEQSVFSQTGGIHAAALFSASGDLLLIREDVGRHNALDKLVGAALLQGTLPWRECILLVSGRLSYELVQKAAMAGTPLLAAIGAPSSLAIELAEQSGLTLVGFLRSNRLNCYSFPARITG